jgi:hypothetical protein
MPVDADAWMGTASARGRGGGKDGAALCKAHWISPLATKINLFATSSCRIKTHTSLNLEWRQLE